MAMLRLASSKVVGPTAIRAIASPRILSGSITDAFSGSPQVKRETPSIISHHFSTDAKKQVDKKLAKILKSEFKFKHLSAEKSVPATPSDFAFTIRDDPCERHITLTREFDGEKIDVLVEMPRHIPEDDEEESDFSDTDTSDEDSDDNGGDGGDDSNDDGSGGGADDEKEDKSPSVRLQVTISKENGRNLEFEVSASDHEIKINSMSFKEPAAESSDQQLRFGPHCVEDEGDLQLALREYLEIRGIKETNFGFLYEYMVRKAKQRPTLALKELRKFLKE